MIWGINSDGKPVLKHEEPNAGEVMIFYDKILSCTNMDLSKIWFKHMVPTFALLTGEDYIKEFGQLH